jgi:hypothetical protein
MLNAFSRRRAQPRRFHYEPRFYDPAKEERLKLRMRVARTRARPKTKQPQFIAVALGLLVVLYLYLNIEALAERAAAVGGVLFGG